MSKRQKKTAPELQLEAEKARLFGKHVSREKAWLLLAVTMIACALPMIMGVRMWDQIPEIVPSGLIGVDGQDDSLPRWVVVFGLSGLMCLLNLITHIQLMVRQKRMVMPSPQVRLMGRWGFPVISVIFCTGMILESSGAERALPLAVVAPCILGLVLLILGGHMWDCPREARIALRFPFFLSDAAWRSVHRFAGGLWLAVGLLVIAQTMVTGSSSPVVAAVVLLSLVAPVAYGYFFARHLDR